MLFMQSKSRTIIIINNGQSIQALDTGFLELWNELTLTDQIHERYAPIFSQTHLPTARAADNGLRIKFLTIIGVDKDPLSLLQLAACPGPDTRVNMPADQATFLDPMLFTNYCHPLLLN